MTYLLVKLEEMIAENSSIYDYIEEIIHPMTYRCDKIKSEDIAKIFNLICENTEINVRSYQELKDNVYSDEEWFDFFEYTITTKNEFVRHLCLMQSLIEEETPYDEIKFFAQDTNTDFETAQDAEDQFTGLFYDEDGEFNAVLELYAAAYNYKVNGGFDT